MSGETIALAAAALMIAGFVQGLTGFGFGLSAMGLLPIALHDFDEVQALSTVAGMACFIALTGVTLRHVQWSGVRQLWLSTSIAIPLGYYLLKQLPEDIIFRMLGAVICLLVLFEIFVTRRYAIRLPGWSAWPIGLISGALSGAFNVGGPPLVAWVYDRPWTKEQQVATLSGMFLSTGIIRLAIMHTEDHLTTTTWTVAAWSVGPMILAIIVGNRLLKFVPQDRLRSIIYAALLLLGAWYLVFGH